MVRYADDFVMGFERLEDVHKVQRVIAKRFARFGLEINTEKTRLVRFGRPSRTGGAGERPEAFDFLGFTHYWGKSQKGNQVVKKKTAAGRFQRTLQAIKKWGMEHRHLPMKVQQRKLNEKLSGHDCYYGVTGNIRMLSRLRYEVTKLWRRWLQRRNRSNNPNWEKSQGMLRARSFHLIDFPLTRDIGDTVERAHCSKIRGQERVTPWRNLTEMSATRRMASEALSAQLPERVLSSFHCTSRVPWLRISQPPQCPRMSCAKGSAGPGRRVPRK